MKENTEQNEALLCFMEGKLKDGLSNQDIRKAVANKFKLGGKNPMHTLRAWLARLNDPTKYGGRHVLRVKPFMQQRNTKTQTPVVQADAVIETMQETSVEVN